jgi:membrane-associated phospholipid phosphatase
MDPNVLIQNDLLFSNLLIEIIPHPTGIFGHVLNYLTIFCHYMAGIPVFIVLLPILYFFYNQRFGTKMGIAIMLTGISNGLLKFYSASPRPTGLSEKFYSLQDYVKESSFGFPSGHSHISILLWGMIFLQFKDLRVRALAIFFMIFTPFSRIYSGIHYPGDVLGGILTGIFLLFFLEVLFKKYPDFPSVNTWNNPSRKIKSITLILIAFALSTTLLENQNLSSQHKHSMDSVISAAGSMIGFWFGISYWKFNYPNLNLKSLHLFPLVLFLLLNISIFYLGFTYLGKIFDIQSSIFRILKYGLLNFSIVYISPFLTLRYMGDKIKVG